MSDGATLFVTVAIFVDRLGRVYGGAIEPDQAVDGDEQELEEAAAAWLRSLAGSA